MCAYRETFYAVFVVVIVSDASLKQIFIHYKCSESLLKMQCIYELNKLSFTALTCVSHEYCFLFLMSNHFVQNNLSWYGLSRGHIVLYKNGKLYTGKTIKKCDVIILKRKSVYISDWCLCVPLVLASTSKHELNGKGSAIKIPSTLIHPKYNLYRYCIWRATWAYIKYGNERFFPHLFLFTFQFNHAYIAHTFWLFVVINLTSYAIQTWIGAPSSKRWKRKRRIKRLHARSWLEIFSKFMLSLVYESIR